MQRPQIRDIWRNSGVLSSNLLGEPHNFFDDQALFGLTRRKHRGLTFSIAIALLSRQPHTEDVTTGAPTNYVTEVVEF